MDRMKELVEILNNYAYHYYVLDNPIVSDKEYDVLYDELLQHEKQTGEVLSNSPTRRVGGEILKNFKSHRHLKRLYSLDKAQDFPSLESFYKKVNLSFPNTEFSVEYKFDGLTISLTYENGRFVKAATRGNGEVGEDVTAQVLTIKSFPLNIEYKGSIEIQGEGIMRWSVFNKYNATASETLKNPRNAVAGAIRNLDSSITAARKLDIIFYNIGYCEDDSMFKTQKDVIDFFKANKFKTSPKFIVCKEYKEIEAAIKSIESERAGLDFMIDGVVIKVNDMNIREQLGYTQKFPRYAIAYKFEAEEITTILNSVEWQVGRTGKLTPLAYLEPVELNGVTVKKATLNNYGDIQRKNVKIGSRVLIRRSNDVIPEILGTTEHHDSDIDIVMPSFCPSCGYPLVAEGANLFCRNNDNCKEQIVARIEHFASKDAMNIEGLSEKTANLLVSEGLVVDVSDLYALKKEQIEKLEGFKDKKVSNLLNAIETSKNASLDNFIFALGIANVGKKTAKDLSNRYRSFSNLQKATMEELLQIDEIGEIIALSIVSFFADENKMKMISKLFENGILLQEKQEVLGGIFSGEKVVLTGTLEKYKRGDIAKIIEGLGGEILSSVTNATTLVIAGEKAGSKLEDARKKGIKIISENDFEAMIK